MSIRFVVSSRTGKSDMSVVRRTILPLDTPMRIPLPLPTGQSGTYRSGLWLILLANKLTCNLSHGDRSATHSVAGSHSAHSDGTTWPTLDAGFASMLS